jgi:hypothetical protein
MMSKTLPEIRAEMKFEIMSGIFRKAEMIADNVGMKTQR